MLKFLNKENLNIDQPEYKGSIVARQIWTVKAAFWMGGSTQ